MNPGYYPVSVEPSNGAQNLADGGTTSLSCSASFPSEGVGGGDRVTSVGVYCTVGNVTNGGNPTFVISTVPSEGGSKLKLGEVTLNDNSSGFLSIDPASAPILSGGLTVDLSIGTGGGETADDCNVVICQGEAPAAELGDWS